MNAEIWTLVAIIAGFLALSLYLLQGKGAFLIAGFNTMPKEEQEQYDVPALCKAMGQMMLVITGSMLFYVAGALMDTQWPFAAGTIVMIASIIIGMIYINTGSRFKKP